MYPQACEMLKRICQKNKTGFDDLEVVVGPWKSVGLDLIAAYMDKDRILKAGRSIPVEPVRGLKVYPPFILIDDVGAPSVSDRTNFIIHEYQHYLNRKMGVVGLDVSYDMSKIRGNTKRFIKEYLGDKDEEMAHITQMKSLLALGMSTDEVVKFFMPNGIKNVDDVAMAAKYNQLVDMAARDLDINDLLGPTENDYETGDFNENRQAPPGDIEMGNPQNRQSAD